MPDPVYLIVLPIAGAGAALAIVWVVHSFRNRQPATAIEDQSYPRSPAGGRETPPADRSYSSSPPKGREIRSSESDPVPWDQDRDHPLDRTVVVRVTHGMVDVGEKIHIWLAGEEATVSVQLRPEMRDKVVRLPYAISRGAGHLFLRLQITDRTSPPVSVNGHNRLPDPQPTEEDAEVAVLLRRLRNMALGDDRVVHRLIAAEQARAPERTFREAIQAAIAQWEHDRR
jgi:hypothetical protein